MQNILRLRQRYIYTRKNTLRLRYVAGGISFGFIALFSLFHVPSQELKWPALTSSPAHMMASLQPASGSPEEIVKNRARTLIPEEYEVSRSNTPITDHIKQGISDSIRKAALTIKKPLEPRIQEVKVGRGETIAGVLKNAGLSSNEAYYAVKALSQHYDPRRVKPGQKMTVYFKPVKDEAAQGAEELKFSRLSMKLDPVREIHIQREGEKFTSKLEKKKLKSRSYARHASIETSLYGSAARAGIPSQIIAELIRIYSWDIDFQRDIRRGDKIEVLYETLETEDGQFARYGDLLYASLNIGGKRIPIYRYEMNDGRIDYFEPDGRSIRKTLMKTPVDGARLSSGFGMRKHPVLGYNKMHKGTDFAAPTGTPIYAAGDGVLDYAGRKGAYGNYIRIRHNGTLKTAYAHMSRFGKGMGKGKRVEQGDVIGYVGTTGRSTGPHLHYEVLVNNKQVSPNSVNLPIGERLKGQELKRFKAISGAVKQQYAALNQGLKLATR